MQHHLKDKGEDGDEDSAHYNTNSNIRLLRVVDLRPLMQGPHDLLGHFLCVGEEHHGVVGVE
jgi:hypothetical protein